MLKKITHLFSILLLSSTLTSCLALTAGGAAGAYIGSDERTIGTIIDDAAITTKINGKLLQDDKISSIDINIDTNNRIVTLHGDIESREDEERLIQMAKETKGVIEVISKLKIDSQ